jgi:tape measure domain-containing protein
MQRTFDILVNVKSQGASGALGDLDRRMRDLERTTRQTNSTVGTLGNTLRSFGGILAGALSAKTIVDYSNAWGDLNSRLVNATGSQESARYALEQISQTARNTYSNLNDTAEAFLNNATVLTELGYNTQQQIQLSDALNNALVISGTSGDQARSVMQALSKSFASGKVSGDQLNTILESGGRVAQALAQGLGVTTLELRKLGSEGGLTTARVFEALVSQQQQLNKEAAAMPATIRDGFTLLNNALFETVGRFDEVSGASSAVSQILVDISDAIRGIDNSSLVALAETLKTAAIAAGVIFAGAIVKKTTATVASTIADVNATRQTLVLAQATAAATAQELAMARASQLSLAAQIPLAQSERTRAAIRAQLAANTAVLVAAERAHASALVAVSAAQTGASVTATALGAAWRFALGPIGLAITAIGGLALVFKGYRDEANAVQDATDKLTQRWERMSNAARGALYADIQKRIIELEQLREEAAKPIPSSPRSGMLGSDVGAFVAQSRQIKVYQDEIDALNQKLTVMNDLFQKGLPADNAMSTISEDAGKAVKEMSSLERSLINQVVQLRLTEEQYELYVNLQRLSADASDEERVNVQNLTLARQGLARTLKEEKEARESAERVGGVFEGLRREAELINMSNTERERAIRLDRIRQQVGDRAFNANSGQFETEVDNILKLEATKAEAEKAEEARRRAQEEYMAKQKQSFENLGQAVSAWAQGSKQAIQTVIAELVRLAALRIFGDLNPFVSGFLDGFSGRRINGYANGGNFRAGETFIVGERGPEIMTASAAGMVIPNHVAFQPSRGGNFTQSITFQMNGNVLASEELENKFSEYAYEIANQTQRMIKQQLRPGGVF